MTKSQFSLLVGLLLGVVAAWGSIGDFLLVALFAAIGLVIGRILDGKLDVQALLGRSSQK
ncbi:MAG: hypothetical protein H0T91_00530 [Propionibacteriaceae bacterium]|nr:hypothetical protein [Propionibacteriaceae bacterium]